MVRFVIDDKIPYIKGIPERWGEVRYLAPERINAASIRDADVLIVRTRTQCNEALLGESCVRFVGTATIGYDHIDRSYCERAGIVWRNAPGCNADSVVQYVLSVLMRRFLETGVSFRGQTIGVVGVGAVGSRLERACRLLGMRVLLNDPPRATKEGGVCFVSLEELLRESDVVSLHTPLSREGEFPSFHLLNRSALNLLKPGALLLNAARGEVVDNRALLEALGENKFSAVLDCWEGEPFVNRELQRRLWLGTPHIAGYSADGKYNGSRKILEEVALFLGVLMPEDNSERIGKPQNTSIRLIGESEEERIAEALLSTYDPRIDSEALRANPADFERLRGAYGLRREYKAYEIESSFEEIPTELLELGFKRSV